MRLRAALAAVAIVAAGLAALAAVTDGYRAATTDGALRLAVAERARSLPQATLLDQSGRALRLSDLRGRPVLVEFFYTTCPAICGLLVSQFQAAADGLVARPTGRRVVLLSISLDRAHDTVAALADYGARLGVDGQIWRLARVADPVEMRHLLDAFGVVVLPDGAGGFTHNAAVYRIDAEGRLAGIYDPDQTERAVREAGG